MSSAIVVGAGCRGFGYSQYALSFPDQLQIVGVAEPREFYRKRMKNTFNIPEDNVFSDWKDILMKEKFADCVFICTPDRLHKEPAVALAKLGYNILLEKPMAVTAEDCREIVKTCQSSGVLLCVCHVLRYTPWAKKIKELIDEGTIGEVVNIQHLEPVGYWHFAHSFVRGNWHKESTSANALLAKCCHDVDLINFWMSGSKCTAISSFGHLNHFNQKSKPSGAAHRCLDCPSAIERKCPYSAKKIYLDNVRCGHSGWPVSVITEVPDIESVTDALRTGPYGVCAYDCDNDVMSNQIVNMEFEGGKTASLTMMAFTDRICEREVQVFGTKGQLKCIASAAPKVYYWDFTTEDQHVYDACPKIDGVLTGHGGADFYCMESFLKALKNNNKEHIMSGPEETLQSHLMVFAAEEARKQKTVVKFND